MADTTVLDALKSVPDYLKALGDDVIAATSFIKVLSDALPDETRSIVVEVVNLTSRGLQKGQEGFDSGGFGPALPDPSIPPFSTRLFTVESSGLATGVIGNVAYIVEGLGRSFNVHFSNPFVGGNTQSVQSSVDDVLDIRGDISNGNHTHARYLVMDRSPPFPNIQKEWRSCPKCQGMHFAGLPGEGICPAGGRHTHTNSFAYDMVERAPVTFGQERIPTLA